MSTLGRWIGHLIGGIIQGFVVLAVLAAVVSVAFTVFAQHKVPTGVTLVYIVVITVISGLLGAVCVLAWRLSHIGEFFRLAKSASSYRNRNRKR